MLGVGAALELDESPPRIPPSNPPSESPPVLDGVGSEELGSSAGVEDWGVAEEEI